MRTRQSELAARKCAISEGQHKMLDIRKGVRRVTGQKRSLLWGAPPLRRLWRGARRRALGLCGALAGLSSLSGRPQSASAQVCAPGAASVLATVQRLASGPVRELGTAHVAAVPVRVRHVRVGAWRGARTIRVERSFSLFIFLGRAQRQRGSRKASESPCPRPRRVCFEPVQARAPTARSISSSQPPVPA